MKAKEAKGISKIANFMIALGPEYSGKVLKLLPPEIIEQVSMEVANISYVDKDKREGLFNEFVQIYEGHKFVSQGGFQYAKDMLESAMGRGKAEEIINKLMSSMKEQPFGFAKDVDSKVLANVLRNEHSQTIALILSHLESEQASKVLSMLSPEQQINVATRIALMEQVSPDALKNLADVMSEKFAFHAENSNLSEVGGIQSLVDILNQVDRSTEKTILERMAKDNPSLAEEIRNRLFVFEDIISLEDSAIQKVLQEVDSKDLALAVRGSSQEVQDRVYANLSKRAAELLREEIEYLGPVRLRDIEEAQQGIVNIIRRLEDEGQIVIARGGEDVFLY